MDHNRITSQLQADIQAQGKIEAFFKKFRMGTLLNQCGIRKRHGYSARTVMLSIFTLPFIGKNFFRGIVINQRASVSKDAAYDLLKGTAFNWRKLLSMLAIRIYSIFNRLTRDDRDSVLIIDDSTYDRSRSKKVELLSRVYDHCTGRYLRGFRLLTLSWSDGVSCLPLDFALLSSSKEKNRYHDTDKVIDKRCCAYQRRREATTKATAHLAPMVERALKSGIRARYLLMDRWFTMPANISALRKHVDVIGMVKKTPKVLYDHNGRKSCLTTIYRKIRKRPGKAKILASSIVTLNDGKPVKLIFVRDRRKKDWLALLSTDTRLADSDAVRIYGKRWDIEVFFKMAKQHLKLAKEIQCRDFDALIAHTTIVFIRYMFVAYQTRMETDHRSFGDLFYECCDEMSDISFLEALYRILLLAIEQVGGVGTCCNETVQAFFDAILDATFKNSRLSKSSFRTA